MPLLTPLDALPPAQRARILKTWAAGFRDKVYPLLLQTERHFATLYDPGNGRPNWSVARMVGIVLLQGMLDLPDQEALDMLAFDFRWQHALDLWGDEAYLSRHSLVDFRGRLVSKFPDGSAMRTVFDAILTAAVEELKLSVHEQRLDSTRIMSNIVTHGRGDLFGKTLDHFVREYRKMAGAEPKRLPAALLAWATTTAEGSFGWQSSAEVKARLPQLARWLVMVRDRFVSDEAVRKLEAYQLVERVIEEHITVLPAEAPQNGDGDAGAGGSSSSGTPDEKVVVSPVPPVAEPGGAVAESAPIPSEGQAAERGGDASPGTAVESGSAVRESGASATAETPTPAACPGNPDVEPSIELHRPKAAGSALQSPYDPDAGYGHKGQGYHVQIAETCRNDRGVELITDFDVHSAGVSDQGKASESLERLRSRNIAPDVYAMDPGYVSGPLLLSQAEQGREILGPVGRGALPVDAVGRDQWKRDPETGLLSECPEGNPVIRHGDRGNGNRDVVRHAFVDATPCGVCPKAGRCMARSGGSGHSQYHIEDTPTIAMRDARLTLQRDPVWRKRYGIRSGIEGTNSELKRKHGLGRLRVRRAPQVRLAVAAKLTGCNIKRWLRAAAD